MEPKESVIIQLRKKSLTMHEDLAHLYRQYGKSVVEEGYQSPSARGARVGIDDMLTKIGMVKTAILEVEAL